MNRVPSGTDVMFGKLVIDITGRTRDQVVEITELIQATLEVEGREPDKSHFDGLEVDARVRWVAQ